MPNTRARNFYQIKRFWTILLVPMLKNQPEAQKVTIRLLSVKSKSAYQKELVEFDN